MTEARISPRVGVLAIQGDYAAHAEALAEVGAEPAEIRKPEELTGLHGLVLPGGESTTILKFLEKQGFFETLRAFCNTKPVFATCAGTILLAREVTSSASALSRRSGRYGGTQRLRTTDRLKYLAGRDFPARWSAGDGLHPRTTHCASRRRRRGAGNARRLPDTGAARTHSGGDVSSGALAGPASARSVCGYCALSRFKMRDFQPFQ